MTDSHQVQMTRGDGDTVLPELPGAVAAQLEAAEARTGAERRAALGEVVAMDPRCLAAWADLAEGTDDLVERYAYARVGYHRGLDALRAAGWRGSGRVRWRDEPNRGFLRALDDLRAAAGELGEVDEAERCGLFLRQLDPDWPPPGR